MLDNEERLERETQILSLLNTCVLESYLQRPVTYADVFKLYTRPLHIKDNDRAAHFLCYDNIVIGQINFGYTLVKYQRQHTNFVPVEKNTIDNEAVFVANFMSVAKLN